VIVNSTPTSGISCLNDTSSSHPGWDWLAARDAQGWRFVSASADYANITTLEYADQVRESCGSLEAFALHGLDGAQGMFAYPNNKWTAAIQTDPVSTCFDYGRRYGSGTNVQSEMQAPWFSSVLSSLGDNSESPTTVPSGLTNVTRAETSRPIASASVSSSAGVAA